jgi:hypothetical protein
LRRRSYFGPPKNLEHVDPQTIVGGIDGSLVIEQGSIADLLEMAMESGYGHALRRALRAHVGVLHGGVRDGVRQAEHDDDADPDDQASGHVPVTRDDIAVEELRLRAVEGSRRPPMRLAGE